MPVSDHDCICQMYFLQSKSGNDQLAGLYRGYKSGKGTTVQTAMISHEIPKQLTATKRGEPVTTSLAN